MGYSVQDVAEAIDHTVLRASATDQDIIEDAEMCIEMGVGGMCVSHTDLPLLVDRLRRSDCVPIATVGFPFGADRTETKVHQARLAIEDGALELDMVMNVGKFIRGDNDLARDDIAAVVEISRPHDVLLKVILETASLDRQQIAAACKLAEEAGADFVKTSTGLGDGGATHDAVDMMVKTVGSSMGVKASGGLRTWQDATSYLDQGCSRLGTSATRAILDGAEMAGLEG